MTAQHTQGQPEQRSFLPLKLHLGSQLHFNRQQAGKLLPGFYWNENSSTQLRKCWLHTQLRLLYLYIQKVLIVNCII